MTRVRIFTVFLIAIIAGGGLAYGTYDYLQNVPVHTVTVPTRHVVVANGDLSLGRQLRREDLATIDCYVPLEIDFEKSEPRYTTGCIFVRCIETISHGCRIAGR